MIWLPRSRMVYRLLQLSGIYLWLGSRISWNRKGSRLNHQAMVYSERSTSWLLRLLGRKKGVTGMRQRCVSKVCSLMSTKPYS
uniref:Uncharacterized protein n=1 Tax=Setaria italica TaxID=4555 RepID=K3Y4A1_SETIT